MKAYLIKYHLSANRWPLIATNCHLNPLLSVGAFYILPLHVKEGLVAVRSKTGPMSDGCIMTGTFDLCLQAVAAEFQNESAAALAAAATRHLQEAEQAKNSGNEHW